jgi:hypothetical protein
MRPQPGIWVISPGRPRAPVRMVTMRTAAEDLAACLAAEQARAREAHEHLAERVRADSTWRREELRQVLDGRASVLEEARAELRARAGRAGRELDHVRAERAEVGRA